VAAGASTEVVIVGASGRMGRRLVALGLANPAITVAGALERPGHESLGADAGLLAGVGEIGLLVEADPAAVLKPGRVVIDFTSAEGTRAITSSCVDAGAALVVGSTGLTAADHGMLDEAAKSIAVLQAANMSLGVNLLLSIAAQTAERLGEDYDIEIVETHHRFKRDAPSGTAMRLLEVICEATGRDPESDAVHGRHGVGEERSRREIGMHAIRSGDVTGRHTVSFGGVGEELQLTHLASDRDVFARGALRAASWLAGRPAGRYGMADVLGLEAR